MDNLFKILMNGDIRYAAETMTTGGTRSVIVHLISSNLGEVVKGIFQFVFTRICLVYAPFSFAHLTLKTISDILLHRQQEKQKVFSLNNKSKKVKLS